MDRQSKESVANADDELKAFARPPHHELAPGELDQVAGGAGVRIDPDG